MKKVKLKAVDSTNKEAFRLLEENDFVLVSAEKQTDGYGRNGAKWVSSEGNIFFSVGKKTNIDFLKALSHKAVYFVFKALYPLTKENLTIKWPNDILLNGKKVAGILVETKIKGNSAKAVIGVGINYFKESVEGSGYLKDSISVSKTVLEHTLFNAVTSVFTTSVEEKEIFSFIVNHSFFQNGDRITLLNNGEKTEGFFCGFSEDFGIKIKIGKKISVFYCGEVKKVRKN